jgi:glycosyltransferase involved in cell wall biosynthesis
VSTHLVVPGDVDDPTRPSGGNAYDRQVRRGLGAEQIAVDGPWPRPDDAARAALDRALSALPDGATVLLDGLVACGVPEIVERHAVRLDVVVLVHLPLGDEVGGGDLAVLERRALRAARAVVATSPWTARRLRDLHGLDQVPVAAPGAHPAPLARGTDGATRLLCVGSITATKGQDLLVDALGACADQAFTCDLVGPLTRDPEHVAAVRAAISRHGLDGRVRLTGPLVGPALAAAYAEADLLVLPSRVEAYGMVVTEALARGIPVLAADAGGVRDALDGAGTLVPPGDVAALAEALRRWWTDPALRDGMRAAARTRRERLDGWEVTSRCLSEVLQPNGVPG